MLFNCAATAAPFHQQHNAHHSNPLDLSRSNIANPFTPTAALLHASAASRPTPITATQQEDRTSQFFPQQQQQQDRSYTGVVISVFQSPRTTLQKQQQPQPATPQSSSLALSTFVMAELGGEESGKTHIVNHSVFTQTLQRQPREESVQQLELHPEDEQQQQQQQLCVGDVVLIIGRETLCPLDASFPSFHACGNNSNSIRINDRRALLPVDDATFLPIRSRPNRLEVRTVVQATRLTLLLSQQPHGQNSNNAINDYWPTAASTPSAPMLESEQQQQHRVAEAAQLAARLVWRRALLGRCKNNSNKQVDQYNRHSIMALLLGAASTFVRNLTLHTLFSLPPAAAAAPSGLIGGGGGGDVDVYAFVESVLFEESFAEEQFTAARSPKFRAKYVSSANPCNQQPTASVTKLQQGIQNTPSQAQQPTTLTSAAAAHRHLASVLVEEFSAASPFSRFTKHLLVFPNIAALKPKSLTHSVSQALDTVESVAVLNMPTASSSSSSSSPSSTTGSSSSSSRQQHVRVKQEASIAGFFPSVAAAGSPPSSHKSLAALLPKVDLVLPVSHGCCPVRSGSNSSTCTNGESTAASSFVSAEQLLQSVLTEQQQQDNDFRSNGNERRSYMHEAAAPSSPASPSFSSCSLFTPLPLPEAVHNLLRCYYIRARSVVADTHITFFHTLVRTTIAHAALVRILQRQLEPNTTAAATTEATTCFLGLQQNEHGGAQQEQQQAGFIETTVVDAVAAICLCDASLGYVYGHRVFPASPEASVLYRFTDSDEFDFAEYLQQMTAFLS